MENESLKSPDQQNRDNLLPDKIRVGLNELKEADMPFYKKAEALAVLLKAQGCQDVEVMDCDVCVEDFFPEFGQKVTEVYDRPGLSEEEQYQEVEKAIPIVAKVRVQAQTSAGYFTYCFGCDSTMCENEVVYPEETRWDEVYKEKAVEILKQHPGWQIEQYRLDGSTRNRIIIDVVTDSLKFTHRDFDVGNLHITINFLTLKTKPEIGGSFESLD